MRQRILLMTAASSSRPVRYDSIASPSAKNAWPYSAAFRPKNIFAYGHPITEPAFSLFIILALSGLYTYVLLSLP